MNKSLFRKAFNLSDKSVLIILRFLVIVVSAFLVIYGYDAGKTEKLGPLFLVLMLYILSNIAFIFVNERRFSSRPFRLGVFILDVLLISLLIYFSRGIDTDLYLAYFLIIFMSGGKNGIGRAFMMTIVVVSIYVLLLSLRGGSISLSNPVLLLRIPFFFILSFIFLYYSNAENRELEKQVAHMERLSALGEMLAAVLHEIRNPVSVLLGYSAMLKEEKDEVIRKKMWDHIVSAADNTSRIIKNIMAYVKQGEAAERHFINLNSVVQAVDGLIKEQLKFDNVSLRLELCPEELELEANAQSLEQVFINIINNARNALLSKPKQEPRNITVRTSRRSKAAIVEISDNGPGMNSEQLDRLFEPFFTTREEGTGLGLSMCYKIIMQHNGKISAKSQPGLGTAFTVELPLIS
jgi:signal transduction histidine kinase